MSTSASATSLEDLEMAATLHLDANKRESRWGWFADVFWSSLGRNFDNDLGEYDLNMIYLEGAGNLRLSAKTWSCWLACATSTWI